MNLVVLKAAEQSEKIFNTLRLELAIQVFCHPMSGDGSLNITNPEIPERSDSEMRVRETLEKLGFTVLPEIKKPAGTIIIKKGRVF